MFKKISKKMKGDKGGSESISLVFLLPLIIAVVVTIFDMSGYFFNRSIIQGAAQNGARTVAIMGGDGTVTKPTSLGIKYGLDRDEICGQIESDGVAAEAYKSSSTAIECNIIVALQNSSGLMSVKVEKVNCTPSITEAIGQRTSCEIVWGYKSIPASGLGFMSLDKDNLTTGSSESEVMLGS